MVGAVLMAHRLAHYFSYNNYKLLQVLSGHIGLAITNATLHAEVRRMVIMDNLTGLYARHYLDEQIKLLQTEGLLRLVDRHGHRPLQNGKRYLRPSDRR